MLLVRRLVGGVGSGIVAADSRGAVLCGAKRFYGGEDHSRRVGILGAPLAKGQVKPGVEKGPEAIRQAGLQDVLQRLGLDVTDYGDVEFEAVEEDEPHGKVLNPRYIGGALHKVSCSVSRVLQEGRTCLTLGGDHSLGVATVFGHFKVFPNLSLLWVDAHADINTALTTNSGNMHGMPLSLILQQLHPFCPPLPGLEWLQPCLDSKRLAYIALRDVEPLEILILRKLNVRYFCMQDVDKMGIHSVVEQALDAINPRGESSLHVSFDIDALDKTLVPCTGTPVYGGLTLREAVCIGEEISRTGTLRALDLVEVNPTLGTPTDVRQTVSMALSVVGSFFGQPRTGSLVPNHADIPLPN